MRPGRRRSNREQRRPLQPLPRGAAVPAEPGVRGRRGGQGRPLRPGGQGPAGLLGRAGPSSWTGTPSGTQTLDWNPPFAKWFVGGKLNVAVNCVDRHVAAGNGDRVAFHWQGDPADDKRTITYAELQKLVCQAANALTELGVKAGDRVAIYMPMIPETVVDAAGLRAHRRAAHGRVRRLLGRGACAAASTTPMRVSSSPPTGSTGAASPPR